MNDNDYWETPDNFFKLLDDIFHFDIDVCANGKNTKCPIWLSEEIDALKQNWEGKTCFCNPPYSELPIWLEKCYYEGQKENTKVVAVIPNRTGNKEWHDWVHKAKEIWFCRKRVNFLLHGEKTKNGCPFDIVVVIFDNNELQLPIIKSLYHRGD